MLHGKHLEYIRFDDFMMYKEMVINTVFHNLFALHLKCSFFFPAFTL